MTAPHADQNLVNLLDGNYTYLRGRYRLEGYDAKANYSGRQSVPDHPGQFYVLRPEGHHSVTLQDAVKNLYQLILHIHESRPNVARQEAVLLLRSKCLIYEVADYTLSAPAALGVEFTGQADEILATTSLLQVRGRAEELNGRRFDRQDEGTRVVKDLLLAALYGAHYMYRRHEAAAYERALAVLTKLNHYIEEELPAQHEEPRESYGLMGLAQYLTGRILSAQGSFTEARQAFRLSTEAYAARVRQKEDLLRRGKISQDEFHEKNAVTLRRAALAAAFGDGHLSFVMSRITRSLEALTLARAVLTHNSGRVYLVYVDLLYWACKRAAHSSDRVVMEQVVREMQSCRKTLCELVPETHYVHRAGYELAIALYYVAKIAARDGDGPEAVSCYESGLRLLDEAVGFAETEHHGRYKNPHLLADALVMRSHFLRLRHRIDAAESEPSLALLTLAQEDTEKALHAGRGIPQMECEAVAAQGAVQADLAKYYRDKNEKEFERHYNQAQGLLYDALRRNKDENLRLEGVCYLRLAKLSLLGQSPHVMAHHYFEQWEKVKGRVEHAFCHETALELRKNIQEGGPILVIEPNKSLDYKLWRGRLFDFLIDFSLKQVVDEHPGKFYTDKEWAHFIVTALQEKMGYSSANAFKIKDKHKLVGRLKKLKS